MLHLWLISKTLLEDSLQLISYSSVLQDSERSINTLLSRYKFPIVFFCDIEFNLEMFIKIQNRM